MMTPPRRLLLLALPRRSLGGRRPLSLSAARLALPPSTDRAGQPSATGPPGHTASPDPWPLPFTEAHLAATTSSAGPGPSTRPATANPDELELRIEPIDRSYETDLAVTRKRLVYQARKRGMLEGDLLLATFARDELGRMTAAEVAEFDQVRRLVASRLGGLAPSSRFALARERSRGSRRRRRKGPGRPVGRFQSSG